MSNLTHTEMCLIIIVFELGLIIGFGFMKMVLE